MDKKTSYDIEALQAAAAEKGKYNYKNGLNCGESVLKAWIDLGLTYLPAEAVAMASGLGGGLCRTHNACGAIVAATLAVGSMKGRKDPFAKSDVQSRIEELHEPETGTYPVFDSFIEEVLDQLKYINCEDLCASYDMDSIDRKRNCKKIIASCLEIAVKHALK